MEGDEVNAQQIAHYIKKIEVALIDHPRHEKLNSVVYANDEDDWKEDDTVSDDALSFG